MKSALKVSEIARAVKGSGGGSSTPRPPVESPDSLVSIGYARLVDLISEGEIKGLVSGAESIILDGTPAQAGGVLSFSGFAFEQRVGTQDQEHLAGFPAVESNISVGVELRQNTPYIRAVTNSEVSALRINFRTPRLAKQNMDNGDTTGHFITYSIDVAEGTGPFVTVKNARMDGKTIGGYDRSERVDLPGSPSTGWRVRVRRTSSNSNVSNISDDLYITSVSEIIDSKFRYPNSAVIGLSFDAQSFGGSIPSRGYLIEGRIIRVPSNYDPETRQYQGIWNGASWKLAYTNNPVWCYLDLLLHPRYGLGERLTMANVDRWSLYQIAQYCDELVDDGRGGKEPRFTLNTYLQSRSDAYKLLQDLASVFRGISYWGAGMAKTTADMPSDPIYTYTNANVIEGRFSYRGAKRSTRYTAASVSWNDPQDGYKIKTEYVEHPGAVARHGLRKVDMAAFGSTSQGQAQRAGHWALLTNNLEQDSVSFSVSLDYMFVHPGAIINVADNDRAGRRIGGRILQAARDHVVVDKAGGINVGDRISVNMPDGKMETLQVQSIGANGRYNMNGLFSVSPISDSVFVVESDSLVAQLYRVVGITENGPLQYTITAVQHEPQKFAAVDSGTLINPRPISNLPTGLQAPPTNLRLYSDYQVDQFAAVSTLTIAWDAPPNATAYDVEWRRDDSSWVFAGRASSTEIQVVGIFAGNYDVRVKAINAMGVTSVWQYLNDQQVDAKPSNIAAPVNLVTTSEIFAIRVDWQVPEFHTDMKYTELQISTTGEGDDATATWLISYPTTTYTHTGMGAGIQRFFRARFIDTTGNQGPWTEWVLGVSSSDASEILDYLAGEITMTELGGQLVSEIEKISGEGPGSVNERLEFYREQIEQELQNIQVQLAEIEGAAEWNSNAFYPEGSLVRYGGALYRARINVPQGVDINNVAYWEKIGDYATIGEAVAALAVELNNVQIVIDQLTGQIESQASSLRAIRASFFEDNGEGELWGALQAYKSQAQFVEEVKVRSSQNQAMAERVTELSAEIQDAKASIQTIEQVIVNELQAMALQMQQMQVQIGENSAEITEARQVFSTFEQSYAEEMTQINVKFTFTEAQLADLEIYMDVLADEFFTVESSVNSLTTAVANLEGATAQSINELNSRVGQNESTIQVTQQTVANLNGRMSATYSIRVGVTNQGRYYAAGMAIGVENSQGGMQSQVLFLADRFGVLNISNGVVTAPFVIQGGQTIINNAIIGDATITFAKITDSLQSTNYVPNQQGWKLYKDGTFDINGNVPGQGRMRITNQRLEVYDNFNRLVVRLGIW